MRVSCILRTLMALAFALHAADAQLRPRRVGVGASGDQQQQQQQAAADSFSADDLMASMGGGVDENMLADLMAGLGDDPTEMLTKMMAGNPMLKGLAEANPEIAQMMSDPEMLKSKMEEVANLLNSEEGRSQVEEVANTMKSFLTDPEKMKAGLEELKNNPMFKGFADAMPPQMKEILDNPELLSQSIAEMTEQFASMGSDGLDFSKMAEMMAGMGGADGADPDALRQVQEQMMAAMGGMGGMGGMDGEGTDGEGGDALKGRVREQLASMLRNRQGMGGDAEEF